MKTRINKHNSIEQLQPKLRFPEFKGDWKEMKLEKFFTIFNGFAFSSSASVDKGVLWVKIADVGIQEMKKDNVSFLPYSYKETHSKFELKKGDYVIALTRPILGGKLKIAKIDDFFQGSLLNQRVGKIVSDNDKSFIYSYLQKEELIKSIENNIAGSDPPNLSPNEINQIIVYTPTLPEQTKIATFLSAVDEKLNLLKEKKQALEDYKKGMMQKIFSQEIRFKDANGNNFADWEEKSFTEVFKSIPSKQYQIKSSEVINQGLFPVIDQGKEIIAGFSDDVGKVFRNLPVIIFGDHTTVLKFITFEFIVGADGTKLLNAIGNSNLEFLHYNLCFNNVEQEGYKRHFSILTEKLFQIPSLEEQTKIANFLSAIDEKISLVSEQIEASTEYKKGLLQQLFC